jgi:uncharacterized sulfatase
MCSPTRHNIYTGLYPVKSGAYPNHTFVKEGTRSVGHYLKPLGYRVALSGKKHINPAKNFPFEYSGKNNPDFAAIETLFSECREQGTPFCLFVCSNEPHTPWDKGDPSRYPENSITLPPYFVDTPETRHGMSRYLAEITYLDGQVGQCLDLIDKYELADNTLFIFTSEQGSSFPFAKWTCYDTGLQTAFIARWPGHIKANSTSDALIEYVDVLPTFLEAAGSPIEKALEGRSFLNVLLGNEAHHKDYVYGIHTTRGIINGSDHYGIRSVRNPEFKYILNLTPNVMFQNICQQSPEFVSWLTAAKSNPDAAEKVRRYQHRPAEELYRVSTDKYEWNNLADDPAYAEIKTSLRSRLDAWMKAQGDQGQKTELEAFHHQYRKQNRKRTQNPNR